MTTPTRARDLVLASARIQTEAALRRDTSSGGRQYAGTLAERVRSPAPEYQSEIGAGRELVPTSRLCENSRAVEFHDTVKSPDFVSVDASRDRLELANAAGALESGLDLADSIDAQNSMEKMLAHQMAAVHRSSMKMMGLVNRRMDHMENIIPDRLTMENIQTLNVETCRLAGTVARMMNTYQQGMLTLERVRNRGTQHVIVQRIQQVNVNEGGQAVVVDEVKQGGGGSRKRQGIGPENEQ